MNASLQQFAPLLGRVLIALLFIPAGLGKIGDFQGAAGYIAAAGVPLPAVAAVVTILVEVGVAAALLMGWQTRWAALILALFTLAAALIFHAFWASPADQKMLQSINFFKNLAIVGGLLFVAAHGAGPYSVDGKRGLRG
jgi:putative oxidoreductase